MGAAFASDRNALAVSAIEHKAVLSAAHALERFGYAVSELRSDADGVVQTTRSSWLERLKQLCGDPGRVEQFLADVFEAERPCLTGNGDFAESLSQVLRRWNSSATVSEALRVWTMIEPDADAFRLIRGLRSNGTLVALATNQQRYRAAYMLDDLEFDHVFCSCDLGHAKPAPEYFSAALDILALPATSVLFIDDHDANVEAARRTGLRAHRYTVDEGAPVMARLLESYGLDVGNSETQRG